MMIPWMAPLILDPPWHALKKVTLEAMQPLPFAPCVCPRSIEVHVDGSGRDFDDGGRAWNADLLEALVQAKSVLTQLARHTLEPPLRTRIVPNQAT